MTDRAKPVDLLVLEPAVRGHGHEWLVHLAAFAGRCTPVPRLAFAVAPPVADRLLRDPAVAPARPAIIRLSEREVALCTHRRLAVSGLVRWWTMWRHLGSSGARHGLFLEFDHLTLPLAVGMPLGAGRSVSGILFRPSVHYDPGGLRRPGERLRDLRKNILYRLMLTHSAVRRVHTLDDAFPAFARARYRSGAKVAALPDPVYPPVSPTPGDNALAGRVPDGRILFVLFGVLTERKGILALPRALRMIDGSIAGRIAVLMAGEVDTALRPAVEKAFADLSSAQPSLWYHLEARKLNTGEIAALVDRARAVLAPYQRFVGSSGVLMWAAGRGRPVITQDYGLLGRLVREHGLGLAVDTTDPAQLARAIERLAHGHTEDFVEPADLAAFAAGRTPDAFAAGLLDPVMQETECVQNEAEFGSMTGRGPPSDGTVRPVTE